MRLLGFCGRGGAGGADVAPEDFGDAPGLGDAAAFGVRGLGVENFADGADAAVVEMRFEAVEELARAVKKLSAAGEMALVLVEQNSRLALDIAPRAVVMDRGRIVFDGASAGLRDDPARLEQLIGVVKS